MISLTVAVVLVSLAVPTFRDLVDKSRLRSATDDIVTLLNFARASAVKLGLDVNVSITGSGSPWCAGAVSATNPESASGTIGNLAGTATACDCTAGPVTCLVGDRTSIVSSASYSGATIGSVDSKIAFAGAGLTFNSKFGALDLSNLPGSPLLTVTSPTTKYSTQVSVSPLGQTYVCVPSGRPFVSGYPSC